ncbi:YceI family protein [Flavobacterium nackdongense]|uniref:YceI family protein n=1 Tax=Flavobacterium nackdongense TaxID=2547394 RepID=A0A4P6Y985_9FLAO|nr:YceI family protein [Flavobacterium nackdongense]QBN18528.1 YceI family protein [Flavobacterium nackdongense]
MKKNILFLLFFIFQYTSAQTEMRTASGIISFEASVPFYEEVTATNKTAVCILELKNGQLSSRVQMKDFRFKLSLMEEHFNKKYLETDDYPQASFKGIIEGFNINIIGESPKEFKLKGDLKIHGKSKKVNSVIFLKKEGNGLEIVAELQVNTKDYNIAIPEILRMKVAETVQIKYYFFVK